MSDGMDETAGTPSGEEQQPDFEERLKKIESLFEKTQKELEAERKASAGKDSKITQLLQDKKSLQEATLSKDQLLAVREKELEQERKEWEERQAQERRELESLRLNNIKRDVLKKIPNFPIQLEDRIKGNNAEEIEADARSLMLLWTRERDKVANAGKAGSVPKGGDSKAGEITAKDVLEMSEKERFNWAGTAKEEDFMRIMNEINSV